MPGRRTLSGLVVLALLAATVLVTYLVYDNEREGASEADQELARQVAVDARQEVVSVAAGLRGSAAIVESDGDIDPSRFRSFARGVVEGSPFLGLSWAPRVSGQERAGFEQELGRPIGSLGADGLEPLPPDESGSYLPLAITYPNSVARREFLGFDTLSDPARGEVAREALDAGEPRLSRPILLAQTGETGASIYAPVSQGAGDTQSTVGVMISGVPGKAIAADLRRQLDLDSGVTITDEGKTLTGEQPPPGAVSAGVSVLGRRWEVWVGGHELGERRSRDRGRAERARPHARGGRPVRPRIAPRALHEPPPAGCRAPVRAREPLDSHHRGDRARDRGSGAG